jgi:hypothetical protein
MSKASASGLDPEAVHFVAVATAMVAFGEWILPVAIMGGLFLFSWDRTADIAATIDAVSEQYDMVSSSRVSEN